MSVLSFVSTRASLVNKLIYNNRSVQAYCLFTSICIATQITLSFMGKYPFSWNSRWDIGTRLVFSIILYSFYSFIGIMKFSPSFATFIFKFLCFCHYRHYSFRYSSSESVYSDISYRQFCDLQSPSVLANHNSLPSLKYLLLQGHLSTNSTSLQYDGSIQIKNPRIHDRKIFLLMLMT